MESKCLSFAKDSITKLMVVSLKKKKSSPYWISLTAVV